jgi:hypothetical protein
MKFKQESITRFIFYSETQNDVAHMVDLLEGECSCQNFQFRIKPLIERGVIEKTDAVGKCKHMKHARNILCDQIIEQLKQKN